MKALRQSRQWVRGLTHHAIKEETIEHVITIAIQLANTYTVKSFNVTLENG